MAAYAIQFRRGNTTQHNSFTGLLGEVTVDTDKKTLVVHDGSTTGGFPLAREGAASVASSGSFTSNVTVGGTLAVTSTASFSDDVSITGDLGMAGHIIPSANITYDLGSTTNMWRDIYVGPGSLYVNGKKVIEDNNGSINFTTDTDETLKIVVPGTSGTLQFSAGSLQLDGEINAITGDITFGDHLDMNSNRIKNVSAPVEGADSANKTYVDSAISSGLSGGTLAVDATTGDFSGDVTVGGSLTVTGTVTTVNSETIELADNILLLNSNALGNASQSGGIEVERGDDLNVQLLWDETNDRWSVGAEDFKAANFIGDLTGDVTGTVSSLSNHDTDDLAETSTNRYFTPAREAALSSSIAASAYNDSDTQSVLDSRPTFADGLSFAHEKRLYANGGSGDPSQYIWATNTSGQVTFTAWKYARGLGQSNLTLDAGTGAIDVKGARIFDLATPIYATDASNKGYVDSEIATLSATVAANAYGDGDVRDFLEEYDSNIVLSQSNNGIYLTSDVTESSVVIKNNSGGAFVYASKIQPFGSSTDLELEAKSGGKINVNGFRVYDVGTPTDSTDAANKSYVDGEISTLSATVASGAYDDSDVTDHLTNGLGIYADLSGMKNVYAHTYNAAPGNINVNLQPASGGRIKVGDAQITDVATPTGNNDAATKGYVDGEISTLSASVAAGAYGDSDVGDYLSSGSITSIEVKEASTGPTGFPAASLAHTLENPNFGGGSSADEFGYRVAVNDTHVLTVAPSNDGGGAAYVFNLSDGSLAYTLPSPNSGGGFGVGSVMSNSYAAIPQPDSGIVHIYDTSDFTLQHSIVSPDNQTTSFSEYGESLAIDETHVLIGDKNTRKVYLFDLVTGQLEGTISDYSLINFGDAVAMSSSYIAVSYYPNSSTSQTRIYNRSDLSFVYSISNPNMNTGNADDKFGKGLKITDTHVFVGADWEESQTNANNAGVIYAFNISDGSLAYTIHNPEPSPGSSFALRFDIDGSYLVASNYYYGTNSGKLYIFDLANNASLINTFDNPNAYGSGDQDMFGLGMAIKGNNLVVGAFREDDASENDTGRVYVFKAPAAPEVLFNIDVANSSLQIGADMTVGNTATFNSDVTISSTPTNPTDAANKAYVDAAANTSVANATGVNLDISNQDTDELSEGSANLYFTDARAVAAVKSALSMTHSGVYVVTTADDTGNTASTHAITAATLGFDLSGKEFYQVFLNRQLLRPTEYTVNSSNGTVTFSADVIATDDEIEAVIYG